MNIEVNWYLCTGGLKGRNLTPQKFSCYTQVGSELLKSQTGRATACLNQSCFISNCCRQALNLAILHSKLRFFDAYLKEFLYLLWLQLVQQGIQKCLVKYSMSVLQTHPMLDATFSQFLSIIQKISSFDFMIIDIIKLKLFI